MIFLSYANDPGSPLPTLSQEDEAVHRLLSLREAKRHFRLHRESHQTLAKIAEYLTRYRNDLILFSYSGHAERDRLFLEGQEANSEGIAELLGQCPRLKLVILNGCSTVGQTQKLLSLPNKPAVIATSAPVNDTAATQFAISFFQAFSEQYATVQEAFFIGLAAAQAASSRSLATEDARGIGFRKDTEAPVWLLEVPPGAEDRLSWKLPGVTVAPTSQKFKPNQLLLEGLLESLAMFDPSVKDLTEEKGATSARLRSRRRLKKGDNEKRNVILKCLPLPISEQIEKLVAKRRDHNPVFYDTFSFDRLRQLLRTYDTALELPAFILLAQLYDLFTQEDPDIVIYPEQVQVIEDFLTLPYPGRLKQLYYPLIEVTVEVLRQNQRSLFMPELAAFSQQNDLDFYNAFQALEGKKERLEQMAHWEEHRIGQECIEAEEMLTEVLSKLGFLSTYSLVSVRNIDVWRNRLFRTPSFVHRVVHLAKKDMGDPEEVEEELDDFLENESVLLMKKQPLSGKVSFLNLTPFIIDENAYVKKADTIKLHFFHHYRAADGAYCFKHTYKPDDPLLEIREEPVADEVIAIQDVWAQLEDFRDLVQTAVQ